MEYYLFFIVQWLQFAMLVSLSLAAWVAFRRIPASWSLLLLCAAGLTLAAYLAEYLAFNTFATNFVSTTDSVTFQYNTTLHIGSRVSQSLGSIAAIVGGGLAVRFLLARVHLRFPEI